MLATKIENVAVKVVGKDKGVSHGAACRTNAKGLRQTHTIVFAPT